ncbi:MAG: hypothetical protein E7384_04655 [Ruminococcaceae bacterium]|nr:hypothetical protein [Oscillospiraceae bacterium]
MKIFISSDIEGTCGAADWDEALNPANYHWLGKQMTKEVSSAVQAAYDSGAEEVLVRDAHGSARNLDHDGLPVGTQLIRGWAHDIYCMMTGIDRTKFDAAIFTGYHSGSKSGGNPLSHTMHRYLDTIKINGTNMSEFMLNAYTAGYFGVPVVFISGDEDICNKAKQFIPDITTVPVIEGIGGASICIHPAEATEKIYNGVKEALSNGKAGKCLVKMPSKFEVVITYVDHITAFHNSSYPGASLISDTKVRFCATDYLDVLRFLHFCAD